MLAAIEPDIPAAHWSVHEGAMMGLGLAGMGVWPEMAAADAHALNRNGAGLLQSVDDLDLRQHQVRLFGRRQRGDRGTDL